MTAFSFSQFDFSPVLFLLLASLADAEKQIRPVRHFIDTHVHLYDTGRDGDIT